MTQLPTTPETPSRMEIAAIAAALLGKVPERGNYEAFSEACNAAVLLLDAARVAAEALKASGSVIRAEVKLSHWGWEHTHAEEEERTLIENATREAEGDLAAALKRAGFSTILSESDGHRRLPWPDFVESLYPKKPPGERLPRLRRWLRHKFHNDVEKAEAELLGYRKDGVSKEQLMVYYREFPGWWEAEKSRINRKGGDALRQKLLEEKEKAQKEEERKRLAQIQNGTAAGDVGKNTAPKKKTKKKPSA
jgi:hypothetical protein